MAEENSKTHAVVNFTIDNSVEVVPKTWVMADHKHTYFPPLGVKKLKKMVKDGVPPDPKWQTFECRIYKWFGKSAGRLRHTLFGSQILRGGTWF